MRPLWIRRTQPNGQARRDRWPAWSWWPSWLPHYDTIVINGHLYMRRWKILPESTWRGGLRLHQIMRSDDRMMHDHPWNFVSFGLNGTYVEETPRGVEVFEAPFVNRKKATDLHMLTVGDPVWTVVVHGRKQRQWGFQTSTGWRPAAAARKVRDALSDDRFSDGLGGVGVVA